MSVWWLGVLIGCGSSEIEEDDDDGGGLMLLDTAPADGGGLTVELETTLGLLTIALDEDAAPATVENFLGYVDSGFYDGTDGGGATIFHRVIDGFVAQGGGYTASGEAKSVGAPIPLESDSGRSNLRGTIAMARTDDPDSATSQFYFNLVDNDFLDYAGASSPGYAVFGELTGGLEVLDAIGAVQTDSSDRPVEDVVVTACQRR